MNPHGLPDKLVLHDSRCLFADGVTLAWDEREAAWVGGAVRVQWLTQGE